MSKKDGVHRVSHVECPVCGSGLNAARSVDTDEGEPRENDLSICGYCSAVMVFDKDIKTRIITDYEWEALKKQAPDLYNELNKAIQLIQNKGGNPAKLFN